MFDNARTKDSKGMGNTDKDMGKGMGNTDMD